VLEYLSPVFDITLMFYIPNIQPYQEYSKREAGIRTLLSLAAYPNSVEMLACGYDAETFCAVASPFWEEPEGGRRCQACFELRLGEAARQAKEGGYDCFTTTLSVSPHKDAALINEVGSRLAGMYGVEYLRSDFKKCGGYHRCVELSKQYSLYRQSYCGCKAGNV